MLHQAILEVIEVGDAMYEHEVMEALRERGVECDTGELHAAFDDLRSEGKIAIAWALTREGFQARIAEAVSA